MQTGVDSISLSPGWGQVEDYFECGNESLQGEKWLDQPGSYHLLEDFFARNQPNLGLAGLWHRNFLDTGLVKISMSVGKNLHITVVTGICDIINGTVMKCYKTQFSCSKCAWVRERISPFIHNLNTHSRKRSAALARQNFAECWIVYCNTPVRIECLEFLEAQYKKHRARRSRVRERVDCNGGRRDLLGTSFEVLLMAMTRKWINICV